MNLTHIKQGITKEAKQMYKNMRNFSLSRVLQTRVENLSYETEQHTFELNKLKREYELIRKKNEGLQRIEKHFFNGEPKLAQDALTMALREEIKRLMDIVDYSTRITRKIAIYEQ